MLVILEETFKKISEVREDIPQTSLSSSQFLIQRAIDVSSLTKLSALGLKPNLYNSISYYALMQTLYSRA